MPEETLSTQDRADLWQVRQQLPKDDPRRASIDRLLISQPTGQKNVPRAATIEPRSQDVVQADPRNIIQRFADATAANVGDWTKSIHARYGEGPMAYGEAARQVINKFLSENAPMIAGGVGAAAGGVPGAVLGGALGGAAQEPEHPASAAVKQGAIQGLTEFGGRLIPYALGGMTRALKFSEAVKPTEETIEGVKIPQLVGEREPESSAGTLQRVMKKSGAGSTAFRGVEQEQTAGSKEALRRSLSRASRTPITSTEPPEAAAQAVSGLERRAKPIYAQLSASQVGIPFDARNLTSGPEEVAWRRAVSTLKVNPAVLRYPNKPLFLLQEYRRNLMDIAIGAQGTTDGYLASAAKKDLDAQIETSLAAKDPRLLRSWRTANALWTRARALDDVRSQLLQVTKGTSPTAQSLQSGARAIPTEIQGASLVDRLNKLDEGNHPLSMAFPDGGKAIRAVADMLDKAQKVRNADPSLWPYSRVLRYGAALMGAAGGGTLAALGATGKGKDHPGIETFAAAAVLAFVSEHYGAKALVHLMTDKEGSKLMNRLATAKSISAIESASKTLKMYLPQIARGSIVAGSQEQ